MTKLPKPCQSSKPAVPWFWTGLLCYCPPVPIRMKLKLELAQPLPAGAGAAISGRPPRKSGKMQCSHQHPNHHHLHRCHHHHSTLPAGTCQGEPLKRRDAVDLVWTAICARYHTSHTSYAVQTELLKAEFGRLKRMHCITKCTLCSWEWKERHTLAKCKELKRDKSGWMEGEVKLMPDATRTNLTSSELQKRMRL